MNRTEVATRLLKIAKELMGSKVADYLDAVKQAKANAKRFGVAFYVNSTSDGLRVEREPVKQGWAGNKMLAEVSPDGDVKKSF